MTAPNIFATMQKGNVAASLLDENFVRAGFVADTLAALKALTIRPESVLVKGKTSENDGWGGVFVWVAGDSTTADDALVVNPTSGTAGRYKRLYEPGTVWVEWFGALGDDSTNNATAIAAAIASVGPFGAGTSQDGGTVRFGSGIFRVGSSIDLTEMHGVILRGLGFATELKGTADVPVIKFEGATSSDVTNKVGICDMIVRGPGKANTSAHGISTKWTNRCFIENVQIFGCRHALNLYHNWQLKLENVQPHGGGSDQNYIGFYLGPTTLTDIDNAVIANGCTAQTCEHAGWRVVNGQGSKFVNCEAGDGAYGWYIGDPSSGTVLCQWLHMVNCLADTCTTKNFYFKRGNATSMGEMIITESWTGTASDTGFEIENGTDFQVNGLIAIGTEKEACKVISGTRVMVSNVTARQYNNANSGYACVKLEDSSNCTVTSVRETSTNARSAVTETGTSDSNMVVSTSTAPTLVGDSSSFWGSLSTYGFQHKRASADAAIAVIGGASNTAYIGLGTEADPLTHNIRRISGGDIEVAVNGARRFQFGDGTGQAGFVNTSDQPMEIYSAAVASLPVWTGGNRLMWASDGRNSGEGAAAGTGCYVYLANGVWMACWSGVAVTA